MERERERERKQRESERVKLFAQDVEIRRKFFIRLSVILKVS